MSCARLWFSLAVFRITTRDQGHYKGPLGAFVTYCNISCFVGPCTERGTVVEWLEQLGYGAGASYSLDDSRARAYSACSRCRLGLFGHFYSPLSFLSPFFLSLGDNPI